VAFALLYWLYYHVFTGNLQEQEYAQEMAAAEVKLEKHNADTKQLEIALLTDAENLAAGEAIYKEKLCATCHGQLGEGNVIGPNLTDNYWIHGATINNVFNTIKNGVAEKGMTPFKDQLPDEKILQVSSYVLHKLHGTNPPNAKEPQGVLVE
jgi:cytochrome c oxidase cbb3-type subunit 3